MAGTGIFAFPTTAAHYGTTKKREFQLKPTLISLVVTKKMCVKLFTHVHILLKLLYFALQSLDICDEVDSIGRAGGVHGMLLQVLTGLKSHYISSQ